MFLPLTQFLIATALFDNSSLKPLETWEPLVSGGWSRRKSEVKEHDGDCSGTGFLSHITFHKRNIQKVPSPYWLLPNTLALNSWKHQVKQNNSHRELGGVCVWGRLKKMSNKCDTISPTLKPFAYRFSSQRQVQLAEPSIQKLLSVQILSMSCTQSAHSDFTLCRRC